MSDSPNPQSPVARFGTSVVGARFEWEHPSADGESVEVISARAAATISFEDVLRYTTGRHAQLVQTAKSAQAMKAALTEVSPTDDDYMDKFNQVVAERLKFEQSVWEKAIEILLILVAAGDRDKLRQPLIDGDPKKVNELRDWLEHEVLASAQSDAAVAANVDPTLRQSPQQSASSPASGDDSGSEESSSTD